MTIIRKKNDIGEMQYQHEPNLVTVEREGAESITYPMFALEQDRVNDIDFKLALLNELLEISRALRERR